MSEPIYPDAGQWINALEAGQRAGMADRKNAAVTSAGGFMANGDYQGAAKALYGAGDFADAGTIAQAGYAQTNQTDRLSRQKAVQQKLATGDYAGAYAAAGTDKDLLEGLDKVAAHAQETTGLFASALEALKDPNTGQWLPTDVAREKYKTEIAPLLLQQKRLDPSQISSFDPTPQNLQAVEGQVLGLAKQLEMHKGVVVGKDLVDPYNGKAIYKGPQYEKVGPDETLLNVGGGGPGPAAGDGGSPAPTGGAAPQAEAPIPTGGVYGQIGQIAAQAGATPAEIAYLQRNAHVESHGQMSVQNGSSTGLFQFHPDTFAAMGGGNINDVGDQTRAALNLLRHDRHALGAMGVEPTDANIYIMHQQGPGGGPSLLTAPPDMNAVQALLPAYKGNQHMAQQAIVGNGGTPDMTAGDFIKMWHGRWANGGAPVKPGANAAPAPQAGSGAQVIFRGPPKAEDDSPMTDEAIDLMATKALQTGVVPPFGMGKAGTSNRNKVYNRMASMAKEMGLTADDIISGNYTMKATAGALTQITKSLAANDSYEQTARANGDLMISLAPKGGGQTGVPVVNRWLQAGRKQIAGDADVTKFDNALGAFSEEYAKVMTGNLGNVAATDAARKSAADRLASYATQNQLQAGLDVMKTEMANRTQSLRDQQQGLQSTLRRGVQPGPALDLPGVTPGGADQPKQPAAGRTPAQDAKAKTFTNSGIKPGDAGNPFVPTSEAQYNKLPAGAHYIAVDGSVRVKGQ